MQKVKKNLVEKFAKLKIFAQWNIWYISIKAFPQISANFWVMFGQNS